MASLRIDQLHRITENTGEQLIYALLSEEAAEVRAKPQGDLVELYLILSSNIDDLPKEFLSEKLTELGWDIHGVD